MLPCYNRGCGQMFDPTKNTDESCRHHPGAPFFHDAYKGWSCCNKKSVDFTEFLSIKGCTLSKHSNVKPPEPEKPANDTSETVDHEEKVEKVYAPIQEAMKRPPIESTMVEVKATVAPALKEVIDSLKVKAATAKNSALASDEISVGTSCKNSGCTYSFTGTSKDYEECQFHPGVPIFHEGMKYWSCCQRKTSDFSVFMGQKGCVYGQHKWIKENDDKQAVQCRYDWHQTATNVIVSIYAKKYHYEHSFIEVNPIRLHVVLKFPEQGNATFELDMELRGIIDVQKTRAHMYGSKVEINMWKAEPGSWSKLDFPRSKLPPPLKSKVATVNSNKQTRGPDSDDEFNLDDIEAANAEMRLSEICRKKDDLD